MARSISCDRLFLLVYRPMSQHPPRFATLVRNLTVRQTASPSSAVEAAVAMNKGAAE